MLFEPDFLSTLNPISPGPFRAPHSPLHDSDILTLMKMGQKFLVNQGRGFCPPPVTFEFVNLLRPNGHGDRALCILSKNKRMSFVNLCKSSSYEKLLNDSNTSTMAIKRVHSFYTEMFKSLNNLNAPYMKDLFHRNVSTKSLRSSNDLLVPRVNQTTFGLRSKRYEGAVM